ncbi:FAD-binding oxidoreductase [Synechococcus sp. RSCCF101]|uniref:FAD-binding oxidoreductase n=1 Tax=Synechococcus sp. RSCCF101 TaxID=2511069 RepID=UPI001247D0E1|nr:FAD-binding protein [Synechococcus sp. RSCCF101]QEY31900.1 FAD-binding oxidoreductase [Synechococcus sp. RSCCF101]
MTTVLLPGEDAYERCLASLFHPVAAASAPERILQPAGAAELGPLLRQAAGEGRAVHVCSGGCSALCSGSGGWMLDLRPGFRGLRMLEGREGRPQQVRVEAGVSMGELVRALAIHGRTVPQGLSGAPGMGYVLSGGIGPLGRRHGLAIAAVRQIELVRGDGQAQTLAAGDAEAWALTGAAPFLAVVTALTLETVPRQPLRCWRALVPDALLGPLHRLAAGLPRDLCVNWQLEPGRIYLHVLAGDSGSDLDRFRAALLAGPRGRLLWEETVTVAGQEQLPPFRWPRQDRGESGHGPAPRRSRPQQAVIGLLERADQSLSGSEERCAELLRSLIAQRPHPACQIASQQMGGAMAEPAADSRAFPHHRSGWKPWITAVWERGDAEGEARAHYWLDGCWDALAPHFGGVHLAQHRPDSPRHGEELERAFGPCLPELHRMKTSWDPHGVLPPLV